MRVPVPSTEDSITAINIAPLVDVILVLLIIFMATAPLLHRRSLNVNVPQAAHSDQKATATMNLVLNEKRELFLEEKKITFADLEKELQKMVRSDPFMHISILADQTIPYGDVISLLDTVRGSGVKKVALDVRPKK